MLDTNHKNTCKLSLYDKIYDRTIFFETIILSQYELTEKKYRKIEDKNIIKPLKHNTLLYEVIKNNFDINPYCLHSFWLCDIYYICQKIRVDLVEGKIDEAQKKLNNIYLVYKTFNDLKTNIHMFQYNNLDLFNTNLHSILSNLCLPKISTYILNENKEFSEALEKKIASNIKNILNSVHSTQYIDHLIDYCKLNGKFKNTHAAVKTTQNYFNNFIGKNIEKNKEVIIKGLNKYIKLLTEMRNRLHEATKSNKWLLNQTNFPNSQFTAKSMKTTLSLLINEQKDYLYKIKCDQKNINNPNESLNYLFLIKKSYHQDTFRNWINNSPPIIYASIISSYGFIFLTKSLEIPFTKKSVQISKINGNSISKKTCFFIDKES